MEEIQDRSHEYLQQEEGQIVGLKKRKFRDYTGRSNDRGDDKRTRQRVSSPDKSTSKKDDPKEGVIRREIKMISGGMSDEGNPPSRKAAKRSRHSCLAVEVMPRALNNKPPRKRSEEPPTL
ncbi:hypothetical protein PIB30_043408 [Stylosanthes scabra]|uniref:Uncharacterized protein n=1 Tax=Stylosanthes scabra TaxID=79078 RepID=A0ABU6SFF8_9FABA|nr:hypothetical protein [Stylosanthes scabra]